MTINNYLDDHYSKYLSQAKEDLLIKWKELDDKLYRRKPKNLIVKDYRPRIIWTPYTNILTFTRRRYFDKKKKNYRYLLDEHLGIDKYKFIGKQYQKLAIFNFESFRSYKDIAKVIYKGYISKMSIHNFIKNYEPKYTMDNFLCKNDGILWINADGMWIKENKTTKAIEIKNFVLFSGRKLNPYTKRWELVGKTMKHFSTEPMHVIAERLKLIINEYDDVREIRLIGDGATWIKRLAKKIGAIYYIDKFHFHKAINDLLGMRSSKKGEAYKIINKELKKRRLKYELLRLVADENEGEVTKNQLRLISYIVNNSSYYIRNIKYDNPINCIEAMQAHYQAKFFKNQRKGWSLKILDRIITFIYSKINKGFAIEDDGDIDCKNTSFSGNRTLNIPGISIPGLRKKLGL